MSRQKLHQLSKIIVVIGSIIGLSGAIYLLYHALVTNKGLKQSDPTYQKPKQEMVSLAYAGGAIYAAGMILFIVTNNKS